MTGCCCSRPWCSASLVGEPGRGKQRMRDMRLQALTRSWLESAMAQH
jgi:hypothetical protein